MDEPSGHWSHHREALQQEVLDLKPTMGKRTSSL
jgi:hypothetical protein